MCIIFTLPAASQKKKKNVPAAAAGSADQQATDAKTFSDSGKNLTLITYISQRIL